MRSPRSGKPPLQNQDNSHSFGGSLNDHSHTGPNLQIIPCLNQHIPQSIQNGFPLLLITLITSTYLLANGNVNLCDDYRLAMKREGCNWIRIQYCFAQLWSMFLFIILIVVLILSENGGESLTDYNVRLCCFPALPKNVNQSLITSMVLYGGSHAAVCSNDHRTETYFTRNFGRRNVWFDLSHPLRLVTSTEHLTYQHIYKNRVHSVQIYRFRIPSWCWIWLLWA